jgi:c-di-GMP-binding flagellar brake protein YcgR
MIQGPEDGPGGGHTCKIEECLMRTREIVIHAPMEAGRLVKYRTGGNFFLRLLSENAIYRYRATFVSYGTVDGFDVVRFKLEDEGEKMQRRDSFRFNCSLPCTYAIIHSSGQQSEREEGLVVDISAGGTKIYTDKTLQKGYLLNIGITLGNATLVAFGDVRTKKELPPDSRYAYQYGIRFAMMPESDKERIVRHMHKLQREELKKFSPIR